MLHAFHCCPGRTVAVRAPESQPTGHLAPHLLLFPPLRVTGPPWGLPTTPPLGWAAAAKCVGGGVGIQRMPSPCGKAAVFTGFCLLVPPTTMKGVFQ